MKILLLLAILFQSNAMGNETADWSSFASVGETSELEMEQNLFETFEANPLDISSQGLKFPITYQNDETELDQMELSTFRIITNEPKYEIKVLISDHAMSLGPFVMIKNARIVSDELPEPIITSSFKKCRTICFVLPSCHTVSMVKEKDSNISCYILSENLDTQRVEPTDDSWIFAFKNWQNITFGSDGNFYSYAGKKTLSEAISHCSSMSAQLPIMRTAEELESVKQLFNSDWLLWLDITFEKSLLFYDIYWKDGTLMQPMDSSYIFKDLSGTKGYARDSQLKLISVENSKEVKLPVVCQREIGLGGKLVNFV